MRQPPPDQAGQARAPRACGAQGSAAGARLPKVRLHPALVGLYREEAAALEQAPADPAVKAEAAEIIRSHIDRITLTPNDQGTLDNPLYGDLAASCSSAKPASADANAPAVVSGA